MGLPNDGNISSVEGNADFLSPNDRPYEDLRDYEQGGLAVGEVGQGMLYQAWSGFYDEANQSFKIFGEKTGVTYVLKTDIVDPVNFTFAFDRGMQPVFAYQLKDDDEPGVFFSFFDMAIGQRVEYYYHDGAFPKLTLDDKRSSQSVNSDVILFYMRPSDGAVVYRIQREKFQNELFLLQPDDGLVLGKVGMTKDYRLGFRFFKRQEATVGQFLSASSNRPLLTEDNYVIVAE